jgi:protein-disulfide isomerase
MTNFVRLAAFCLGFLLPVAVASAAEFTPAQRAEIVQILRDALKQDPSILRDAVTALQADDGDRQQAASRAAIARAHDKLIDPADPVGGNPQGNVTIVEFFDTRCPYCKRLEPTMAELLAHDHQIKLVYKDLPILGPASVLGTRALLAAQRQGGYEKLREAIMAAPPDTTKAIIQAAAQRLGLDWPRLEHDMDDKSIDARIEANVQLVRSLGIEGTPALIIGDTLVPGAVELADLQKSVAAVRGAQ